MTFLPPVPDRFGDVRGGYGLSFLCRCTRGATYSRSEMIQRWGEEGRVCAVAARFRCRNCNRLGARVISIRIGDERPASQRRREALEPLDKLVCDIELIKPSGHVS